MLRHIFLLLCGVLGISVMLLNHTYIKMIDLKDITAHWAEAKIQNLAFEGIIMGYPDRTFLPNQPITRAEAAMVLSQIQDTKKESVAPTKIVLRNYKDQNVFPEWAKPAIAKVTATKVMKGYEDQTFRPNHYVLRKEAIQMIKKFTKQQMITIHDNQSSNRFITRAEFCTLVQNNRNHT